MTLGLKFLLCCNGKNFISKKLHSDIMSFQLQQMYSCEVVGKGSCIIRMGAGRNNTELQYNSELIS